jgi:hypothetical protein
VQDGKEPSAWNRVDLLRYVLEREHNSRWIPGGVSDEDRRVVMLGTLCAPLPLADLNTEARHQPALLTPMTSGQTRRMEKTIGAQFRPRHVPSLQPDILGTLFVLEEFQSLDNDDPALKAYFVTLAWRLNSVAVGLAAKRAIEEFPRHPQAGALLDVEPHPSAFAAWAEAASFAIEQKYPDRAKVFARIREHRGSLIEHIERLIMRYEASLSASSLDSLWSILATLFTVDLHLHRMGYDALWHRVLALPLPRHSLSNEQNFESARKNPALLANLDAVFAVWGVNATRTARLLHSEHRKVKDRNSAKLVRQALAKRAATLSPQNGTNFDGKWLGEIQLRRSICRRRQFGRRYRPSQGGILLSEMQKEVAYHAHEKEVLLRKPSYSPPCDQAERAVIHLQFSADIELGYMLIENQMHKMSEPYAREIVAALKRDLDDPECIAIQQELLMIANEFFRAATTAASANSAG